MRGATLMLRSLWFYRRTHLGTLAGCMVASAVLTGSLLVGDSVRLSLLARSHSRLGRVECALQSEHRLFRSRLAGEIGAAADADTAPILILEGTASSGGGQRGAGRVQVIGADRRFWALGSAPDPLGGGNRPHAAVNRRLAERLELAPGGEILVRVEPRRQIPGETPLVSLAGAPAVLRLEISAVLDPAEFGDFSLKLHQLPPPTVFVPLELLAGAIDASARANVILASGRGGRPLDNARLDAALASCLRLPDAGLAWREGPGRNDLELTSGHVFIDPPVAQAALEARPDAAPVFTWFVTGIRGGGRETPYSFVCATDLPPVPPGLRADGIIVNEWLARDLGIRTGDPVTLRYFVPGPGDRLVEQTTSVTVQSVTALRGPAADPAWTPWIPGLSDAGGCRDWQPGVPIDLGRVRKADEAYWDLHATTPKAFIPLSAGKKMWGNRFGHMTSLRFSRRGQVLETIESAILRRIAPAQLGFEFRPVRREAIRSSQEALDFGRIFAGLSAFSLIAAVLLVGLLFSLGTLRRGGEIGVLRAVGFTPLRVTGAVLSEGMAIAMLGSLTGAPLGIAFDAMMLALLGWLWPGARVLEVHVALPTLIMGGLLAAVAAAAAMILAIRRQFGRTTLELLGSAPVRSLPLPGRPGRWLWWLIGAGTAAAAGILLTAGPGRGQAAVTVFWIVGGLLLVAGLGLCRLLLAHLDRPDRPPCPGGLVLGLSYAARLPGRTMAAITLLALGMFVVTATILQRQGHLTDIDRRDSGTGGFAFYGESALPLPADLGTPAGLRRLGLEGRPAGFELLPLRVREGDEAGCDNLQRIQRPRLLGVKPDLLSGRRAFSFAAVAATFPADDPWRLLKQELPGGTVPALVDANTLEWGLGRQLGEELVIPDEQGRPLRLRFVATLAGSILQGSVLVRDKVLEKHFPAGSGIRAILVDVPTTDRDRTGSAIRQSLADYGLDLVAAGERLDALRTVENAYLAVFGLLGGLGLLLGAGGMGAVLSRNALERRGELALLLAVGYGRPAIRGMLAIENAFILLAGAAVGIIPALAASLPALRPADPAGAVLETAILLAAVLGAGWTTSLAAAHRSLAGPLAVCLRNE